MEPLLPPFRRCLAAGGCIAGGTTRLVSACSVNATLLAVGGGALRFSLGGIVAEFVSDKAAWLTLTSLVSTLLQQKTFKANAKTTILADSKQTERDGQQPQDNTATTKGRAPQGRQKKDNVTPHPAPMAQSPERLLA